MPKASKIPSGFYTGKEAAKRLNMSIGTFYSQVNAGTIEKVLPPGSSKEGYYDKRKIERIAQAKELFILLYSIEPVVFERASSESDVRGIVDMCTAIYGVGGTPSYAARLEIWHHNPHVYYVLKQEGIVVGYVSMIHFTDDALKVIMGPTPKQREVSEAGQGIYSVMGVGNVLPFVPGQAIDSLFISLAVRPGMSNTQQREYGFRLIRDTKEVLIDFYRRGMPVKKLLATSEKSDGIGLARKLCMTETAYHGDNVLRYELDLETSDALIARQYRASTSGLEQQAS